MVKISHESVIASIEGRAPIIGPDIGWHNQFAPGKASLAECIAAGAAITGTNFIDGVPLEAQTIGNVSLAGEVAPPTSTNNLAAAFSLAASSGPITNSSDANVMVLRYTDQSTVNAQADFGKNVKIDVGALSFQNTSGGVFLDLSTEDRFNGKSLQIVGNSEQNYILLGDLDHTLTAFRNSIVESGSGYNHIIIKEGDIGNSYKLGGGGDTIDISGDRNIIDAGAGANAIIVRGSGSNTLISGPGADTIKFTSSTAYLTVTDWNPTEDKIIIGGDLIGSKIAVSYNQAAKAYIVSANNIIIAALNTEIGIAPKIDNSGQYQGTKIVPIDIHAEKVVFINDVYTQALDRAPDRKGLEAWMNAVDTTLTRNTFLKSVFTSEEYTTQNYANTAFVDELYVDLLGRNADKVGQQSFVSALDSGLSRAEVVGLFIGSAEFVQLVGQADSRFI